MNDIAKTEAETVLAKIETMLGASSDSYGSREEWERDVLPAIVGGIMAGIGRGRCRDVFGKTLTPRSSTRGNRWRRRCRNGLGLVRRRAAPPLLNK